MSFCERREFVNLLVFYEASGENDSRPVSDSDGREIVQTYTNAMRECVSKSRSPRSQSVDELWVEATPVRTAHIFIYLFNEHYYSECVEFTGSSMRLGLCLGGKKTIGCNEQFRLNVSINRI